MGLAELIAADLAAILHGELSVVATVTPAVGAAYELRGLYRTGYQSLQPAGLEVPAMEQRFLCLSSEAQDIELDDAISIPGAGEFLVCLPPRRSGSGLTTLFLEVTA